VSLDASSALPFGQLDRIEVYFEHDGPRFFALRSRSLGIYLLALCINDEPEDEVVFLYLVMSPRRFEQVRGGHISLREAFAQAGPGEIWRVTEDYSEDDPFVRTEQTTYAEIGDDDLPNESARLEIPTSTAIGLDPGELSAWASETLRTVAAVELDATGETLTEFPLRGLGQVGTVLQETIDALAQEVSGEVTDRGPIAKTITDDVQMSALALRAASFVLVIGTDKRGAMMDNAGKVEVTLGQLADLIDSAATPELLVRSLREHGSRARGKFSALLRSVGSYESGLGLLMAPQNAPTRTARVTAGQIMRALRAIEEVQPTAEPFSVRRGVLTASHTRRTTFELVDMASGHRYAGRVAPDARVQIDGLAVGRASFVSAELLEQIDFAADDQATGRTYTLLSIEPVSEE
jgi:hypothetical protein